MYQNNLQLIVSETGASTAFVFNLKGDLIDQSGLEHGENFAAMAGVIFTMCSELLEDLKSGVLQQVIIKSGLSLIIGNQLIGDTFLIVVTNDHSKLGLIMKSLEKFIS